MENAGYSFIKKTLLPASLILLTLSVDLAAIVKLGPKVLIMFFGATFSIFVGSIISFSLFKSFLPVDQQLDAWKGIAALCASWIGGGANFVAVGQSVNAPDSLLGLMVIVDVTIASVWMAILLYFAGRDKEMDAKIGADRKAVDALQASMQKYQLAISKPTDYASLLKLIGLSIGGTVFCTWLATFLPDVGTIINGFTWVVILVTLFGVTLSFTPARNLEGVGASALGSTFLYLLIATIGAQGNFQSISSAPILVLIGAVWMIFHAVFMLLLRKLIKAPMFFLAVGSQANIGAAASAPVVASAFHPSLAPVGVMLAILGYVLGTYLGLLNAYILQNI
jgi:uncharacterized membrane protein